MRIATMMSVYRGDNPTWFKCALKSIRSQKLDVSVVHDVFIAIDGPMTFNAEGIIKSVLNNVYIIKSETNEGLSHCLNKIIRHMDELNKTYDYIFRMDADDISLPERYSTQISHMERKKHISVLGCYIEEFDADRILGIRSYPVDFDAVLSVLHFRSPIAHPTACFRGNVFEALEYPSSRMNEDLLLWFSMIKLGYVIENIPTVLLKFRVGSTFYSRRSYQKAIDEFCIYQRGIFTLFGFSYRLLVPIARLAFRFMPISCIKLGYSLRRCENKGDGRHDTESD